MIHARAAAAKNINTAAAKINNIIIDKMPKNNENTINLVIGNILLRTAYK